MRLANGKIVLDDSIHYCLQQTTLPPPSSLEMSYCDITTSRVSVTKKTVQPLNPGQTARRDKV